MYKSIDMICNKTMITGYDINELVDLLNISTNDYITLVDKALKIQDYDMCSALYCYLNNYHNGQGCELYEALSVLLASYNPSTSDSNVDTLSDVAQVHYLDLEDLIIP